MVSLFNGVVLSHLVPLLMLPSTGQGYPDGAPDMVCESMDPIGHGAGSQVTDPPYRLMVTRKSYKPGETLQVTLQSIGDNYFRGFMLQGRLTGCDVNETQTIGVFTTGDNELQTRHCFGTVHSTVTHNSASRKRMKTVYWTAPVVSSGHVIMWATVVREMTEFWTRVKSHVLSDLEADFPAHCPPPPPTRQDTSTLARSSESLSSQPSPSLSVELAHTSHTLNQHSDDVTSATNMKEMQITGKTDLSGDGREPVEQPEQERAEVTQALPGWLAGSFQEKSSTPRLDKDQKVPSWLIPALLSAPRNSGQHQHVDMTFGSTLLVTFYLTFR